MRRRSGQQHLDGAVERGTGACQRLSLCRDVAAGTRQALTQRRGQAAAACALAQLFDGGRQRALQRAASDSTASAWCTRMASPSAPRCCSTNAIACSS
jgi:hypothetical protein